MGTGRRSLPRPCCPQDLPIRRASFSPPTLPAAISTEPAAPTGPPGQVRPGITNGPLSAPNNAGASVGQETLPFRDYADLPGVNIRLIELLD